MTKTRAERDLQDSLAELFSIIVTLDELEKAFLKDAVPEAEYTEICERSLRQYKALLADETISKAFQGLDEFKAKFDVRIEAAPAGAFPHVLTILSSRSPVPQSASASACPLQP